MSEPTPPAAALLAAKLASLLNVAAEMVVAAESASSQLAQAQAQAWTEDDARWDAAFTALDVAQQKAFDRLT